MMTPHERKNIVIESKRKDRIIRGKYIDLFPCTLEHSEEIVKLRNQEKSLYYLNQKQLSTLEGQNKWCDSYAQRDDDIYWCIYNKNGDMVGTVRLYNIEADGSQCEEGSFIIDEAYAMSGPYALEAKLLVFNFAFDVLQARKIINDNLAVNKNMNSISRRMGFILIKEYERDRIHFYLYELIKENYKRADLEKILDKWRDRE